MKNKRTRILAGIGIACALTTAIVLSCILPYCFANTERKSAKASTVAYAQSIDLYDDDFNITDTLTANGEITGLELVDISELTSVMYVHHVPNAFVGLNVHSELLELGRLERLDSLTKASFGTLQFVFFNLDPSNPDFEKKQSDVISRFAYNNSSSVTVDLYLPACFDAATVYCGDKYIYTAGNMGNYNPTEFIDPYLTPSFIPNYVDCTPQHIDLSFTMSQNTISPDRLEAAQIVTVHYISKNGADFSSTLPLIGKRETVKSVLSSAILTHIVLLTIAAAVFFAFAALALLKKSRHMIPTGAALLGVVVLTVSELLIFIGNANLGVALSFAASTLLLGVAVIAVALLIADRITSTHILRAETAVLTVICCTVSLTKAWLPISPTVASPAVFISFLTVALALWLIGYEIFRTEKRDILLRSNLQKEVDVQTETLRKALADREKMLSFISHDMRKSALGISSLTTDLKCISPRDDITNIANKIENKNNTMLKSMSEILTYAKRSYSDEPFEAVNIPELFDNLKAQIREDCNANGITLTTSSKNIVCRAQKNALQAILFNLVFNAIEHAECTQIKVSASKQSGRILISVADNGTGIETDKDIFSPFTTGADTDSQWNSGLGLFIVKSQTENMGGSIICSTLPTGTVFTLSLLREI